MRKIITLINAAGLGERCSSKTPKQFRKICDKELIWYTIKNFEQHPLVDEIYITLPNDDDLFNGGKLIVTKYNFKKVKDFIRGGTTAQESRYNSVDFLMKSSDYSVNDEDIIIFHDACRPILKEETLTKCIRLALDGYTVSTGTLHNAAVFSLDTIDNKLEEIHNLKHFVLGQMPFLCTFVKAKNGFVYNLTLFNSVGPSDVIEDKPYFVELSYTESLKITYEEDLEIFNTIVFNFLTK